MSGLEACESRRDDCAWVIASLADACPRSWGSGATDAVWRPAWSTPVVGYVFEVRLTERTAVPRRETARLCRRLRFEFVHTDPTTTVCAGYLRHTTRYDHGDKNVPRVVSRGTTQNGASSGISLQAARARVKRLELPTRTVVAGCNCRFETES